MRSVTLEIDDVEYELDVTNFEMATPARGWDPGEGGEIELGNLVSVWDLDEDGLAYVKGRIPLDNFLGIYASFHDVGDLAEARRLLEDECYESVAQQLADDFDDREV